MKDIVEKAWIELAKESVFFSYIRMHFENIPTENIRTTKLSITSSGNFRLLYNPRRLKSYGIRFTKALIKHEIYHIIFGHIFIKPKKREKGIWGLAMDASINQYIKELDSLSEPLDVFLLEGHGTDNETLFVTAPINMLNKTAEEYFTYAMDIIEKSNFIDMEEVNDSSPDSHEFESELPEEITFDIISEVVTQAYDKSAGNEPNGIELAISIMAKKNKFDWKTLIRRFFGSSVIVDKYRTQMRPNRRYDDQPGWRTERGPKIAVIVDTSGSIIEEEFNDFFSEIEDIARVSGGKISLIQADENVQSVLQYSKGKWRDTVLKGKGSTDLQPAVDYVEENLRPEGIIVFTDGWVEVPNINRRCFFVLSKKHNPEFFSQVIDIYGNKKIVTL
ncbi:hypothetical protein OSSY52_02560 [Tepiditoga spiralis]|uniref:VWA-like domain-containing protein n=1 Tax=Tepiditoga spiralis TaxID=2108365 RepID=A0A7G1G2M5_9BACT|nr:VWA-like domain-containing protein [Tepiditoga spiralis]BBE30115.1 hypothetical protein OSSY52_02560 [Tepiditoga spiralis]